MEKLKTEKGWDDHQINGFKTKVQNYFMKSIKPNFKDLDVYTGSSMTPEGMYVYPLKYHGVCWSLTNYAGSSTSIIAKTASHHIWSSGSMA